MKRTVSQQIKVVEGARSVKGIYFTMECFIWERYPESRNPDGSARTDELGFPNLRKDDIMLEDYRKLALEWLNNEWLKEQAKQKPSKQAQAEQVKAKQAELASK